ncbi:MAG: hypothetical protein OXI87_15070 [Albidovulum sp.]|nr:hypothetical protein [Albidovulum sp.]
MKNVMRRHLSMPGLLRLVCDEFEQIPDSVDSRGMAPGDCLASGLAGFLLEIPLPPQFDTEARQEPGGCAHPARAVRRGAAALRHFHA